MIISSVAAPKGAPSVANPDDRSPASLPVDKILSVAFKRLPTSKTGSLAPYAAAAAAASSVSSTSEARTNKIVVRDKREFRAIIADDNKLNRRILERFLNRFGILNVDMVDDGDILTANCLENTPPYDVVITDIEMPGCRGDVAARRIKERMAAIPIIACSTLAEQEYRDNGTHHLFSVIIQKPPKYDQLKRHLEDIFDFQYPHS